MAVKSFFITYECEAIAFVPGKSFQPSVIQPNPIAYYWARL